MESLFRLVLSRHTSFQILCSHRLRKLNKVSTTKIYPRSEVGSQFSHVSLSILTYHLAKLPLSSVKRYMTRYPLLPFNSIQPLQNTPSPVVSSWQTRSSSSVLSRPPLAENS